MSGKRSGLLRPRWGDLAVGLALLLSAALLWAALFSSGAGAGTAVVLRDGEEIARLELRGAGMAEFSPEPGVTIRYGGGRAAFLRSDCPDGVCVRTGWLTRPGQSAVCLPKRLILRIEGEGDVDAVSG